MAQAPSIAEQLDRFKKQVDQAKIDSATIDGSLKGLFDQLQTASGSRDTEESKGIVETLKVQMAQLGTEISTEFEQLRTQYPWT